MSFWKDFIKEINPLSDIEGDVREFGKGLKEVKERYDKNIEDIAIKPDTGAFSQFIAGLGASGFGIGNVIGEAGKFVVKSFLPESTEKVLADKIGQAGKAVVQGVKKVDETTGWALSDTTRGVAKSYQELSPTTKNYLYGVTGIASGLVDVFSFGRGSSVRKGVEKLAKNLENISDINTAVKQINKAKLNLSEAEVLDLANDIVKTKDKALIQSRIEKKLIDKALVDTGITQSKRVLTDSQTVKRNVYELLKRKGADSSLLRKVKNAKNVDEIAVAFKNQERILNDAYTGVRQLDELINQARVAVRDYRKASPALREVLQKSEKIEDFVKEAKKVSKLDEDRLKNMYLHNKFEDKSMIGSYSKIIEEKDFLKAKELLKKQKEELANEVKPEVFRRVSDIDENVATNFNIAMQVAKEKGELADVNVIQDVVNTITNTINGKVRKFEKIESPDGLTAQFKEVVDVEDIVKNLEKKGIDDIDADIVKEFILPDGNKVKDIDSVVRNADGSFAYSVPKKEMDTIILGIRDAGRQTRETGIKWAIDKAFNGKRRMLDFYYALGLTSGQVDAYRFGLQKYWRALHDAKLLAEKRFEDVIDKLGFGKIGFINRKVDFGFPKESQERIMKYFLTAQERFDFDQYHEHVVRFKDLTKQEQEFIKRLDNYISQNKNLINRSLSKLGFNVKFGDEIYYPTQGKAKLLSKKQSTLKKYDYGKESFYAPDADSLVAKNKFYDVFSSYADFLKRRHEKINPKEMEYDLNKVVGSFIRNTEQMNSMSDAVQMIRAEVFNNNVLLDALNKTFGEGTSKRVQNWFERLLRQEYDDTLLTKATTGLNTLASAFFIGLSSLSALKQPLSLFAKFLAEGKESSVLMKSRYGKKFLESFKGIDNKLDKQIDDYFKTSKAIKSRNVFEYIDEIESGKARELYDTALKTLMLHIREMDKVTAKLLDRNLKNSELDFIAKQSREITEELLDQVLKRIDEKVDLYMGGVFNVSKPRAFKNALGNMILKFTYPVVSQSNAMIYAALTSMGVKKDSAIMRAMMTAMTLAYLDYAISHLDLEAYKDKDILTEMLVNSVGQFVPYASSIAFSFNSCAYGKCDFNLPAIQMLERGLRIASDIYKIGGDITEEKLQKLKKDLLKQGVPNSVWKVIEAMVIAKNGGVVEIAGRPAYAVYSYPELIALAMTGKYSSPQGLDILSALNAKNNGYEYTPRFKTTEFVMHPRKTKQDKKEWAMLFDEFSDEDKIKLLKVLSVSDTIDYTKSNIKSLLRNYYEVSDELLPELVKPEYVAFNIDKPDVSLRVAEFVDEDNISKYNFSGEQRRGFWKTYLAENSDVFTVGEMKDILTERSGYKNVTDKQIDEIVYLKQVKDNGNRDFVAMKLLREIAKQGEITSLDSAAKYAKESKDLGVPDSVVEKYFNRVKNKFYKQEASKSYDLFKVMYKEDKDSAVDYWNSLPYEQRKIMKEKLKNEGIYDIIIKRQDI